MYNVLSRQKIAKNSKLATLILVNHVSDYLLEPSKTKMNAVFQTLGSLLKYYRINVSVGDVFPLKSTFGESDILYKIGDIICNNNGTEADLKTLIKMLVTYEKFR